MKLRELGYSDLANFYLKSTVKDVYTIVIHNQNVEPGCAEALSQLFGVALTPSDEVELSAIKMPNEAKARALGEEAAKQFTHIGVELWYKGRLIHKWTQE